jgi:hypothetical protein
MAIAIVRPIDPGRQRWQPERLALALDRLARAAGVGFVQPLVALVLRHARRCKLYDVDRGCWTDYAGETTGSEAASEGAPGGA